MKQKRSKMSSRFDHYSSKAPEGLLHDVKAEMERRHLSVGRPHLRENRVELKRVATIAVAAAVAMAVVMVWRHNGSVTEKSGRAGTSLVRRQPLAPSSPQEQVASGSITSHSASADASFAMSAGAAGGGFSLGGTPPEVDAPAPAETITAEATASQQAEATRPETMRQSRGSRRVMEQTAYAHSDSSPRSGTADEGLSLSAYYGGGGTSLSVGARGVMMSAKSVFGSDANLMDMEQPQMAVGSEGIYANMKHHRPLRAGVSLHWRVNRRWGLSTGLTYSYLKSDYNSHDAAGEAAATQHLHYVGIPLNADYSIWQNRRLRVYVTGGGEAQKLVGGHRDESHRDGLETRANVRESRMQWSVNAAAGAEYNFTPNVGFYVEPGVDHHFNNGSDVENYYKHKPTSFSLNLGLRINIK